MKIGEQLQGFQGGHLVGIQASDPSYCHILGGKQFGHPGIFLVQGFWGMARNLCRLELVIRIGLALIPGTGKLLLKTGKTFLELPGSL